MPTKDENNGLLSKVVKFVRNPTASWAEQGSQEADRESAYSKQVLKEMIERKRRNDFVRKREFDMLRKLRRDEVVAGQDAARPSFFQSSMPSKPDDRASTLKKIDEIEAQMSMQWWKTKHGDSSLRSDFPSSHPPVASTDPAPRIAGSERTVPAGLPRSKAPAPMLNSVMPGSAGGAAGPALRPTAAGSVAATPPALGGWAAPAPISPITHAQTLPVPLAAHPGSADANPGDVSSQAFTQSKMGAVHVDEFAHDPELEEASIRFANGDDAGAEAGLLALLAPGSVRAASEDTWLTLFDFYRAIGQQARFHEAALDFAGRFGRSAPQWVHFGQTRPSATPVLTTTPTSAPGAPAQTDWSSPSSLGTQSIAAMQAALARTAAPWRLSWVRLATIEAPALEGLRKVMEQWASQSIELRMIGADNLVRLIKAATVSGDRTVDPLWWQLRMELLRVLNHADEFELAALDYCVTYEVSPPSWERARCTCKLLSADGTELAGNRAISGFGDSTGSAFGGFGDTNFNGAASQFAQITRLTLAGAVLGDANLATDLLGEKSRSADLIEVACEQLVRVDFVAAGTLLNWANARQAEGQHIQFTGVHRLVAAFFTVVGLSEHARVLVRSD